MSDAERKRRLSYKENRKKWIMILSILLVAVFIVALLSTVTYYRLNKTYYIDYSEASGVNYTVQVKDNEFYKDEKGEKIEWLPGNQAYVASLVKTILANFKYEMYMDTQNIDFEYSYTIKAVLEIVDNDSQKVLFNPSYLIKESTVIKQSSNNKLTILEPVSIDFEGYNNLATKFKQDLEITDTTSVLRVTMNVNVEGSCDEFEKNSENDHTLTLNIPLTSKAVNIEMSSSVPNGESKVLACQNTTSQNIFMGLGIGSGILDVIIAIFLVAFVYLTRNEDINYSIKVQRLVNSYRSYIQKITNLFDIEGYQVLMVSSFTEMLGIRDTIMSPILMNENEDQTRTWFLIPTNTKILYMYEIKVENYDELYKNTQGTVAQEGAYTQESFRLVESVDPITGNIVGLRMVKVPRENIRTLDKANTVKEENEPQPVEVEIIDETTDIQEQEKELE